MTTWILIWWTFGAGYQMCVTPNGDVRTDCEQRFLVTASTTAIAETWADIKEKEMARIYLADEYAADVAFNKKDGPARP